VQQNSAAAGPARARSQMSIEAGIRDGRFSRDRIRRVLLDRFASNHWYPKVPEALNNLLAGKPMPAFVPTPSSVQLQSECTKPALTAVDSTHRFRGLGED